MTIEPAGAATYVATARSKDGRLAAVVLHPTTPTLTVTLRRPGGSSTVVHVTVPPS